jgi:exodeoxyribonuclease-3
MRLISWNVNGIRAGQRGGFFDWLSGERADVVAIQETKARPDQLDEEVLHPNGFHSYWHSAQKPGYSGVALYSKKEPLRIQTGIGIPAIDNEGRVIVAEYPHFVLVNAYFPNSQREHARLGYKLEFCQAMFAFLEDLRKQGKQVVLCGDFNIAHQAIDLKNPKANEKNAGYLPEERAWMTDFLGRGYIDAFRHFEKGPGHYTWWSYRPGVREKNIGWRLDYFCVNQEHEDRLKAVEHHPHIKGSDHCPVALTLRD